MLPPPSDMYLWSFALCQNSPKNTGRIDELSFVPALTLSTGITFQTEGIRSAEYYPCGLPLNEASVSRIWVPREQDFLYIRTARGSATSGAAVQPKMQLR
jgi:hypothetical protein